LGAKGRKAGFGLGMRIKTRLKRLLEEIAIPNIPNQYWEKRMGFFYAERLRFIIEV